MSRRTLGILTTVFGSALGAWWWTTQQASRRSARRGAPNRGTVIFENHATVGEKRTGWPNGRVDGGVVLQCFDCA